MEFDYVNSNQLFKDDFDDGFDNWYHEGIGEIKAAPEGGMRLHCFGSRQGREGCMAFFRPTLPDRIAVEYDLCVRSHGGLVINFVAMRGLNGEDMIEDRDRLMARTGIFADYLTRRAGLQSYHVSISRFFDEGQHSNTSNWRRNPGLLLMAHGMDKVTEINRVFHIRVVKDGGHCHIDVDGTTTIGFVDRDTSRFPIPDHGKFGFRVIGRDVMADISNFKVFAVEPNAAVWKDLTEN